MKISHGTRVVNYRTNNGYGYVTDRMIHSLRELGHEVNANDATAPVEIWYDQPQHVKFRRGQYKIAYHPWESTELKPGWVRKLNRADEVWTPSELIAGWYRDAGVKRPVYVYEHGVDHEVWKPVHRKIDDKIRFLHVGGEAFRKGANETLDAFRCAFGRRDDVELTLKMHQEGWRIPQYGNVRILPDLMPLDELVTLYHEHHIFVYPSWGEGFGLNPLQAMATGMPTICTAAWAPYRDLIPEYHRVDSRLVDSPWPAVHPGKMFQPDFDSLVDKMRYTADNYELSELVSTGIAWFVHEKYDWLKLTDNAFTGLEKRLEKSS